MAISPPSSGVSSPQNEADSISNEGYGSDRSVDSEHLRSYLRAHLPMDSNRKEGTPNEQPSNFVSHPLVTLLARRRYEELQHDPAYSILASIFPGLNSKQLDKHAIIWANLCQDCEHTTPDGYDKVGEEDRQSVIDLGLQIINIVQTDMADAHSNSFNSPLSPSRNEVTWIEYPPSQESNGS